MFKNLVFFATIGITFCYASVPDTYKERELIDKVVLITGAARGIGYSIAENFLKAGAKLLILVDKDIELLQQVSEEFNANYGENKTFFIGCNTVNDFDTAADEIINKFGYIDILVNNAGLMDEYDPKTVIETNVLGTIQWSMKFYNIMRQDKGGSCGTIMNIASIAGYYNQPFIASYSATKYAIMGYTKVLGHEYNYNYTCVRVLAICPGFTYTKMTEQQMCWDEQVDIFQKFLAAMPWQEPDSVGKAAVKVFQNADSGTCWDSIGGADPTEAPTEAIITADYLESLP